MCEEKANTIKEESIAIGNLQKPHFFITQIFSRLQKRVSVEKANTIKEESITIGNLQKYDNPSNSNL